MPIAAFAHSADFDHSRFRSPKAIDRGAPFWSWNGRLDRDRLLHQLDVFKQMGLGGAHIHPRTGLETPYLGAEFMQLVLSVVEYSRSENLHAWLYDEDRWPSGFGGGLVTNDDSYRIRHLRLTRTRILDGATRPCPTHHGDPLPLAERTFVAAWGLQFADGRLVTSRRIAESDTVSSNETSLYAYLEIPPSYSWFNNTQYVDTLNPEAMGRFVQTTHERYAEAVGESFGTVIPAIFTDEPLFRGMELPESELDQRDIFLSWTNDLPDTYSAEFGEDLLDVLPDILYDRVDGGQQLARWRFHNHHTDRFARAFAAQLGSWCEKHGIALTGHMMSEPSLGSQTTWVGEAMRSLRHFQLPGIDMLCDQLEFTTAKQGQSVARQTGAPGTMSELYGVTNWDFPFSGHKRQGDWQAALGVVTRVQHLTWYQMSGEAKRDYPASIGEHSPWWTRYSLIEDHFARLNVALKSGRPRCRVAMIHPIESYWLVHGPADTQRERTRLETGFSETLTWLLEDLVDVDFLSEEYLADAGAVSDSADAGDHPSPRLEAGAMSYELVVVPPCITLRSSTIELLARFASRGGIVVMMDGGPRLLDASTPVDESKTREFATVSFERSALLNAVEPCRDIRLLDAQAQSPGGVISQVRELPNGDWIVFVARFDQDQPRVMVGAELAMRGAWSVVELQTESGYEQTVDSEIRDGWTRFRVDLPISGHILVRGSRVAAADGPLAPGGVLTATLEGDSGSSSAAATTPRTLARLHEVGRLPDPYRITLDEDNVLLLDRGEWRIDGGAWNQIDEILRIDNHARQTLGMPARSGNIAQPWIEPPPKPQHAVTVGYDIVVRHETGPTGLALERASEATVTLDGAPVEIVADGTWVDVAFTPAVLPSLGEGSHRLEITWPFGEGHGLEASYLLGEFGVQTAGTHAEVTAPVESVAWGDATPQGLAFYGGSLRYHIRVRVPEGTNRFLHVPHSRGALIDVCWPGQEPIGVFREPWLTRVPDHVQGEAELSLICYGTRINTFGQLHNVADPTAYWWGPQSWRTSGSEWADEYQLRSTGVLVAPAILSGAPVE